MTKWQPPIPSGALWCKPMRALGPAKALVEYCYDVVSRDGWCRFKLVEVADAMDEPYINVKRWWKVLQEVNETLHLFVEMKNRGVRGIEVRFHDNWLDWRILNGRSETPVPNGTKEVSNIQPLEQKEVFPLLPLAVENDANGIKRSTNDVSTSIPLSVCNKVLITTDQAEIVDAAFAAPPAPAASQKTTRTKHERSPEEQAYLDRKKAIEAAYVEALGYTPVAFAQEAKAAKALARYPYTPEQVVGCLRHLQADAWYADKHISLQTVAKQIGAWVQSQQTNARRTPEPSRPETRYWQPPDPNKYLSPAELAVALRAASEKRGLRTIGEA